MDWKTQKVLVAGSGKSGIGATDLLKKVGAEVIIYDGNDKLKEEDVLNKLENKEDVKVILGELEDSVINELTDYGYEVKPIHSALGEYEAIQDIFRQHVQDCIDDLYGKRSPHRPTIPNIK